MSTKIHAVYTLSSARQIPLFWPFLSGPKPPQHERRSVCSVVAGDLYGPCRQLQMNHSPKKHKLGRFLFFFSFQKTCFFPQPRNFPQQIKSKLLKGWVHSCFDFFLYVAQPKRDLTTRQCSEDEHCPSDLTQCQCLVLRKSERGRERRGRKDRVSAFFFLSCYEIVSIFNFKFILNIKHWTQSDELFSQRQQKVSSITF